MKKIKILSFVSLFIFSNSVYSETENKTTSVYLGLSSGKADYRDSKLDDSSRTIFIGIPILNNSSLLEFSVNDYGEPSSSLAPDFPNVDLTLILSGYEVAYLGKIPTKSNLNITLGMGLLMFDFESDFDGAVSGQSVNFEGPNDSNVAITFQAGLMYPFDNGLLLRGDFEIFNATVDFGEEEAEESMSNLSVGLGYQF